MLQIQKHPLKDLFLRFSKKTRVINLINKKMKQIHSKLILIVVVLLMSCSNNDSSESTCIIPPSGTVVNNQTNLTILTQANGLLGVTLVGTTNQELSLQGLDFASYKYFTNWQTVESFNKVKVTFDTGTTEIDITNIPSANKIVLTITKTNNTVTASVSEYEVCNDTI